MREVLIVGLGGFLGSALRFKVGGWVLHHSEGWKFPLSTLVVNFIGCLVIGFLAGLIERQHGFGNASRLFLFTGLLGGFTTFSAFGLETIYLVRTAAWQIAGLNILLSVVLCLAAVVLGGKMSAWW